jgi:hypothetical protein
VDDDDDDEEAKSYNSESFIGLYGNITSDNPEGIASSGLSVKNFRSLLGPIL